MPVYLWVGKNRSDVTQKGQIEAASEDAVKAQLIRQKITPTKIKAKPKDIFENVAFLQPKVKERDIILFARQFSTMIDAGLPIIQCLDILYSQQANVTFKKMLKDIKESVEGGATLAEALKKFPKQFDSLFVNMIAAGEAGGSRLYGKGRQAQVSSKRGHDVSHRHPYYCRRSSGCYSGICDSGF